MDTDNVIVRDGSAVCSKYKSLKKCRNESAMIQRTMTSERDT